MICPFCGSHVPDGVVVCPACHADLSLTQTLPRLTGTYCPSCGALVPEGSSRCPSCGMPVDVSGAPKHVEKAVDDDEAVDVVGDDELDSESTNQLPRFESAVPSESDVREGVYSKDRLPHTKVVILAALASLLVVGGVTLLITHPWDPELFSTRATTDADTSQAGFPGTVSKLQGQDSTATTVSSTSSDPVFSSLSDAYDQLDTISSEIDQNESDFDQSAITGDLATRVSCKNKADAIAIEVSNLVTTISQIDVSSSPYGDDAQHLTTMANWLRNRIDPLCEAWSLSVAADDPSSSESSIKSPVERDRNSSGVNSYKALYSENHDTWKPEEKSS
ncbi:MAG: zinc ribbon domain-containing protein [Atopobiaceae bacterium]|nr:zinc ribbon domain-containing protein [Atopobiaceae bacterium]MCI2173137.1 zinc ribbon domain-containing protein [Atopobiaceae bacterium]MCI2208230.1 zinc ribbon domain-containing protein [Atopobiaceae bacterium]